VKRKTLKAIYRSAGYEAGAVMFWRKLLSAIEADDGSAVAIVNDRLARAEYRHERLLAAIEKDEEVGVRELYRRIEREAVYRADAGEAVQ
jgi:rubrerythrin